MSRKPTMWSDALPNVSCVHPQDGAGVSGISGAGFFFPPCAPCRLQFGWQTGTAEEKPVPYRAQLLVGVEPCKASEGTYIKVLGCSHRRSLIFYLA